MSGFPTRILAATDGSEDAILALRAAADLSSRTGSELHVVYVWPGPPLPVTRHSAGAGIARDNPREHEMKARELLERQILRANVPRAIIARKHLREGRPAEEIAELAEELGVGLLIIGSLGSRVSRRYSCRHRTGRRQPGSGRARRDEDDVVYPQHDLQSQQREESHPDLGIQQQVHASHLTFLSPNTALVTAPGRSRPLPRAGARRRGGLPLGRGGVETQKRADAINGVAPPAGPGPTHRGHRASAFSPYGGRRPAQSRRP